MIEVQKCWQAVLIIMSMTYTVKFDEFVYFIRQKSANIIRK